MFLKYTKYIISEKKIDKGLIIALSLITLLIVIAGCFALFKIPIQEKILGRIELYGFGISREIKSPSEGLINLLVNENDTVVVAQVLATIDWNVSTETLSKLEKICNNSNSQSTDSFSSQLITSLKELLNEDLKQLKIPILEYLEGIEEYGEYLQTYDPENFIKNLSTRIVATKDLEGQYTQLLNESNKQKKLLQNILERDSLLLAEGGISKSSFENKQTSLIENEILKYNVNLSQKANKIQTIALQIEIDQIRKEFEQNKLNRIHELNKLLREIKSQYLILSKNHLIAANSSGKIRMPENLKSGDLIKPGDRLMYIVQHKENHESFMYVAPNRAKEIKTDMQVYISLDDFSPKNIGYVYAKVLNVSEIPVEGYYKVNLDVSYPLISSFGQSITPKVLLTGQGKVLTSRYSLFKYVQRSLRYEFNKLEN